MTAAYAADAVDLARKLRNDEALTLKEQKYVDQVIHKRGLSKKEIADAIEERWYASEKIERKRRREQGSGQGIWGGTLRRVGGVCLVGFGIVLLCLLISGLFKRRKKTDHEQVGKSLSEIFLPGPSSAEEES